MHEEFRYDQARSPLNGGCLSSLLSEYRNNFISCHPMTTEIYRHVLYIYGRGELLPKAYRIQTAEIQRGGMFLDLVLMQVFLNILRIITSLGHKHGPLHKAFCIHPNQQLCRKRFTLQPWIRKRLGHKQDTL